MGNCLIAQSGGPTAVINATLAGIVKANQLNPIYDRVYGGLNGIEGIMKERLVDLTAMSDYDNKLLQQTPSSALGSCRYKLKRDKVADFETIFRVLEKYDIDTMFYIGGNDSMDTVYALDEYAKANGIANRRFVGCPKTIDNDLVVTDHTPGFPSAAKFIATTVQQTWLDMNVYTRREIFILETMGRDAGWLAASSCVTGKVDFLILPEEPFDKEHFIDLVREQVGRTNKCYIVISEGARYADGTYLAAAEAKNDGFGHAKLGGAGMALKSILESSGVTERAKVQDLATLQRACASCQSLADVKESLRLGMSAHMHSMDPSFTGMMVGIKRRAVVPYYDAQFITVPASEVANKVKAFPKEWILPNYMGISEAGLEYFRPLIKGEPDQIYGADGLPAYLQPFYMK